jgi:hypothetical protein
MPNKDKELDKRAKDLNDNDAPTCTKSPTDKLLPRRAKLLNDREAPKCVQSNTDSENTEPSRDNPSTAIDAPQRAKLRRDNEDPI